MKRIIAVYPGSFDPVTNGHIDIVRRTCKLFDEVIIAVIDNSHKKPFFSVKERMEMLQLAAGRMEKVSISHFDGLLVEFARRQEAIVIIRGLRAVSDFEYEFQMALMNRKLSSSIETVFLMPAEAYTYLSSSIVKEIIKLGGSAKGLVPPVIQGYMKNLLTKKG